MSHCTIGVLVFHVHCEYTVCDISIIFTVLLSSSMYYTITIQYVRCIKKLPMLHHRNHNAVWLFNLSDACSPLFDPVDTKTRSIHEAQSLPTAGLRLCLLHASVFIKEKRNVNGDHWVSTVWHIFSFNVWFYVTFHDLTWSTEWGSWWVWILIML